MSNGLNITGGKTNNSANSERNNDERRSSSNRDDNRRSQRSDERKDRSDTKYTSLTEILRPQLGGKNLTPRAELILKWAKLSLAENKELIPEYEIRVGSISREQGYEVRYPGIILAVNHKGSNRVAAHVLLVSDGERIEPKKRRVWQGEDITGVVVPSKIWNKTYEQQVGAEIAEMFKDVKEKQGDLKFASMGCTVVPNTMSIMAYGENPSNDVNPVDPLFVQVVESLTSFDRYIRRDTSKVKLAQSFNSKYQMISANVDQIPAVEFDALGQPRRSDFCISLSIKKRGDQYEDRERDNREEEDYNKVDTDDSGIILRVTGFVTPYYTEPDLDKRSPRNFGLNIVVTDISGDSTPSPELFLFGLACTSVLTANDQWVDGFKPSILTVTPNRNPGGLFLEIPDSDGKAMRRREYPSTAHNELLDDIEFLFSNDVKVSLDCNDSGPLAWITDMFVFNQTSNIFEATDNLTDNEFNEISRLDYDAVVRDETRRFYLGSAETEQGVRDIREVDYLYLINAFDENSSAEAAKEWDYSISSDSEYGLYQRLRATEEVYGHGAFTVTGFTDRVVIEPLFIRDLVEAIDSLRMLPSFDNYSKNHRPKQRLSASEVRGTISSSELGSAYRGKAGRGTGYRGASTYRDRD